MAEAQTIGRSLQAEDLEQLATAAYLGGRDEESEDLRARAHQAFLDRGDRERAARSAFWLAFALFQRGAMAPASGWLIRAGRVLDEAQLASVLRGYLLTPIGVQRIVEGDPAAADAVFREAADIARRFDDRDLASLAVHGRGRALIRLGKIAEGAALLDEAMVTVIAGGVTPILAGDIYCSVLEACQEMFDVRRAYEWTSSFARWCAAQSPLVRYRGECVLYRAEVMQLRGQWSDAEQDAREACTLLTSTPRAAAGSAFYRLGEIHRLRGEFAKAEAAYTRANDHGRNPQPGLSLLRMAQGQIDSACASIRSLLLDTRARAARARALPPAVEILLAAGDLEQARMAAAELCDIARVVSTPLLRAASAHAGGAILLAQSDFRSASTSLCEACELWHDLAMPYEEGQSRLLMAAVCKGRDDRDGFRLELDAARRLFKRLRAEPCLTRVAEQSGRTSNQRVGSLSDREIQVLRLLAAGKTNRETADELFISEKTVARHVSNIFDKLGVSSRAAATAWAYQRNLV